MKDFDVWYAGMIIGNVKADDKKGAKKEANIAFTKGSRGSIAVCACDATQDEVIRAKAASLEV